MPVSLQMAGWWLASALLAAAGTWLALGYARRRRLLDHPGERRSHALPTPRGGGIAIVAVMLLALAAGALSWPEWRTLSVCALAGLVIVSTAGWIDDHRPISPWPRLAMHALAAAILAAGALVQGMGALTALAAFTLAVGLVNVWNFMDGIDGIASTQALAFALAVAILVPAPVPATLLALALAGACCGFLPFNAPRARIFLGDVGSGALGFVLAVLMVLAAGSRLNGWLMLSLPLAPFIVDAALTLLRRIVHGERWWEPHVQHVYQRMARRHAHMPVTGAYLVWSLLAVLCLGWLRGAADGWVPMVAIAWWLGTAALWFGLQARLRGAGGSS